MYGNLNAWDDNDRSSFVELRAKIAAKYKMVTRAERRPDKYTWKITWRNNHLQTDFQVWLVTGEGLEEIIDAMKQDVAVTKIMVNNFSEELVWLWRR